MSTESTKKRKPESEPKSKSDAEEDELVCGLCLKKYDNTGSITVTARNKNNEYGVPPSKYTLVCGPCIPDVLLTGGEPQRPSYIGDMKCLSCDSTPAAYNVKLYRKTLGFLFCCFCQNCIPRKLAVITPPLSDQSEFSVSSQKDDDNDEVPQANSPRRSPPSSPSSSASLRGHEKESIQNKRKKLVADATSSIDMKYEITNPEGVYAFVFLDEDLGSSHITAVSTSEVRFTEDVIDEAFKCHPEVSRLASSFASGDLEAIEKYKALKKDTPEKNLCDIVNLVSDLYDEGRVLNTFAFSEIAIISGAKHYYIRNYDM